MTIKYLNEEKWWLLMRPSFVILVISLLIGFSQVMPVYATGSDKVVPTWKYQVGHVLGGVAISSNEQFIVAGSWDNYIYLFSQGGDLLWKRQIGGAMKA